MQDGFPVELTDFGMIDGPLQQSSLTLPSGTENLENYVSKAIRMFSVRYLRGLTTPSNEHVPHKCVDKP
jgi:hypothetical protein